MKLTKKVLGVLLAAAMVLSLAACGGAAPAATEAPAEAAAEAVKEEAKEEAPTAAAAEAVVKEEKSGVGDQDQNIVIVLDYDLGSFDNCVRSAGED